MEDVCLTGHAGGGAVAGVGRRRVDGDVGRGAAAGRQTQDADPGPHSPDHVTSRVHFLVAADSYRWEDSHMIGIPLGLAVFGYGEWATHKYLLHGLGRDRSSRLSFHYHEHHQAVRR